MRETKKQKEDIMRLFGRRKKFKVSRFDVMCIKIFYATGYYKQQRIANMYKIGQSYVSHIINEKRRTH